VDGAGRLGKRNVVLGGAFCSSRGASGAESADLRLAVSAVFDQTALRSLTVARASQPRERLAYSVLKR
jgi:hypothetical protein